MKSKIVFTIFIFFSILNITVWSFVFAHTGKKLRVDFLDIGQGDSIYIEAPNGNNMLIDGGPDRKVLSALSREMLFARKDIDIVLATHPDADHTGGLPYVFDSYKIGTFIDNGAPATTQTYTTLENKAVEEKSEHVKAVRGMNIILDEKDGVYIKILSPYMNTQNLKDTNTGSIVAELYYGSSTFMFTGDASQDIENYLVAHDGVSLKSNVLKVGHHGSCTSSSELFLKTVAPEYAVISAGLKNRYGHPHKEVLDLLNKLGIKILRTDEEGAVRCESDAVVVKCK